MRTLHGIALAVLLALAVGGCGRGGHDPGVATAGGGATGSARPTARASHDPATDQQAMLRFSQCMRENGVPNFPDPVFGDNGGMSINVPAGTDRATVDAAQQKCKQYLPDGGQPERPDPQGLERMRQFAQCMREHGVPDFPDPSENAAIQIDGDKIGIDPQSSEFKAAEQACAQYQPGPGGTTQNSSGR
jgi:hypothetical protein